MKEISVTEFKAHCLELINQVSKTGEPILLTKHGKPVASVTMPPEERRQGFILGKFAGTCITVGDIISPLDEPWEALQ